MAKVNKKQFPDIPKCIYAGDEQTNTALSATVSL